MLLSAERSQLLIVDLQERLLPAIPNAAAILAETGKLIEGAHTLGVPIVVSEQYPRGIGPTVPEIAGALKAATVLPKMTFSCLAEPGIAAALEANRIAGRDQVVMVGTEAHVCVLQSAIAAKTEGYEVFVVGDAIGSRKATSLSVAANRMSAAGVTLVTTEMVLFEWLGRSGTPAFKSVIALIK